MFPTAHFQNPKGLMLAWLLLPFSKNSVPWGSLSERSQANCCSSHRAPFASLERNGPCSASKTKPVYCTNYHYLQFSNFCTKFSTQTPLPLFPQQHKLFVIKSLLHPFAPAMSTSSVVRVLRHGVFICSCLEFLSLMASTVPEPGHLWQFPEQLLQLSDLPYRVISVISWHVIQNISKTIFQEMQTIFFFVCLFGLF